MRLNARGGARHSTFGALVYQSLGESEEKFALAEKAECRLAEQERLKGKIIDMLLQTCQRCIVSVVPRAAAAAARMQIKAAAPRRASSQLVLRVRHRRSRMARMTAPLSASSRMPCARHETRCNEASARKCADTYGRACHTCHSAAAFRPYDTPQLRAKDCCASSPSSL